IGVTGVQTCALPIFKAVALGIRIVAVRALKGISNSQLTGSLAESCVRTLPVRYLDVRRHQNIGFAAMPGSATYTADHEPNHEKQERQPGAVHLATSLNAQ